MLPGTPYRALQWPTIRKWEAGKLWSTWISLDGMASQSQFFFWDHISQQIQDQVLGRLMASTRHHAVHLFWLHLGTVAYIGFRTFTCPGKHVDPGVSQGVSRWHLDFYSRDQGGSDIGTPVLAGNKLSSIEKHLVWVQLKTSPKVNNPHFVRSF